MLLKYIFLHKEKSINTKDITEMLKTILKFDDDRIIFQENVLFYSIKRAYQSNNVLLDISTKNGKSNLQEAKIIDELKKTISHGKHRKNYNIIIVYDGSSEYFCSKLSRFIAVFERKLRQFIYLTVILAYENEWVSETISNELEKSLSGKGGNKNKYVEKALEDFSFNDYIRYLFEKNQDISSDIAIEKVLNELSNSNPNLVTIKDILKKAEKRSLWEKLFEGYDLEFSQEDLDMVRGIRNKVMHNKEIDSKEFESSKKLLKKLNKVIDRAIIHINEDRYSENVNIVDVFGALQLTLSEILKNHTDLMKPMLESLNIFSKSISDVLSKFQFNTEKFALNLNLRNFVRPQLDTSFFHNLAEIKLYKEKLVPDNLIQTISNSEKLLKSMKPCIDMSRNLNNTIQNFSNNENILESFENDIPYDD